MTFKRRLIHAFARFFIILTYYLIKSLPMGFCVRLGGGIGAGLFGIMRKDRDRSLDNLRKAFPGKRGEEVFEIAKNVFVNQGKNMMELMCFPRLSAGRIRRMVRIEGRSLPHLVHKKK